MTAKHRSHQPKRQRQTSDLERRVRWLERHWPKDAAQIARHVARVELAAHVADRHG